MRIIIPLFLFLAVLFMSSCEEEFTPEIVNEAPDLVVEGYIEAGDNASIPYLTLTKSRSYFGDLDSSSFSSLYVHDAIVKVRYNGTDYPFEEMCLQSLTPEQKVLVSQFLGLNPDSIKTDICVYLDMSFQLKGVVGGVYDLSIESEGKTHQATTTIPPMIPIDSFYFKKLPSSELTDYRELYAFLTDPAEEDNYWRYFTGINGDSYKTSNFSIFDDGFINGQTVEFAINNGSQTERNPLTFGLYGVGDTLSLKWTSIDKVHYDFRKTAEASKLQGPFSSYVRLKGNVSDALGVWGGYNVQVIETIVK